MNVASSSLWTIWGRLFPPLFVAAFMFGACTLLMRGEMVGFIFLGCAFLGGLWIWFFSRHLVSVSFDAHGLHLLGWRRHEYVAWQSVECIRRVRWIRGQPYAIIFRQPTTFGLRVYMIPPLWTRGDVIDQLATHCSVDDSPY
jgi:hypothetical protein